MYIFSMYFWKTPYRKPLEMIANFNVGKNSFKD